jgi:hypothetical protein
MPSSENDRPVSQTSYDGGWLEDTMYKMQQTTTLACLVNLCIITCALQDGISTVRLLIFSL